jgi:hypothetical protein
VPPGSQLKPREHVDDDGVGLDATDVAEDDAARVFAQAGADALAQPWEIVERDRAADGDGDRIRRRGAHLDLDRTRVRNSSRSISFLKR